MSVSLRKHETFNTNILNCSHTSFGSLIGGHTWQDFEVRYYQSRQADNTPRPKNQNWRFLKSCEHKACTRSAWGNYFYCSFKIFSRFWLVKTTRIIHHNQLLFTKFGKNLRHIESITSKVQPTADYWTVDRENLGTRLCYIWWAEKQRA